MLIIDPQTGAVSQAALITGVPQLFEASDLAFRSDGVLFGVFGQALYTVNTNSGAATPIGIPIASTPAALAFSPNDVLYLADPENLYTVNQSTAAVTTVTKLKFDPAFGPGPEPNAMKFDPLTGTLYASVSSSEGSFLGTINVATGAVSLVGPSVTGLRAIAIPRRSPHPFATPAPASVLLLCTGLIGVIGWTRLRRLRA